MKPKSLKNKLRQLQSKTLTKFSNHNRSVGLFIITMVICLTTNLKAQNWEMTLNNITPPWDPNFGTNTNDPINFYTNGTQKMTLGTNGVLKINSLSGTGNRFLQVDLEGNIFPWTGSNQNPNLILFSDGSWRPNLISVDGGTMSIPFGAKFGLGVSDPNATLDVDGDIASTGYIKSLAGFKFNNDDGLTYNSSEGTFILGKAGMSFPLIDVCNILPTGVTWVQSAGGGFLSSQVNPVGYANVNASLRMYIAPQNGNGYIEVNGKDAGNYPNNSLNLNYNCGRTTNINSGPYGGNVNICTSTNGGNLTIGSNNSGNVGIGVTASSLSRLNISSSGVGLMVNTNHTFLGDYNTKLTVDKDYAKGLAIVNTANNPAGDENFIVYGDGRTRIGGDYTTGNESTYKLSVNGPIIAEEVVIMLRQNWPDYVFSKKYDLMPLSKVEEFISKNSHLPNVPAAKEIETNGLKLGNMVANQMEKIEELTLYLIDLKKEVELLKLENETLKKKIK
jgi:hypothetical protein